MSPEVRILAIYNCQVDPPFSILQTDHNNCSNQIIVCGNHHEYEANLATPIQPRQCLGRQEADFVLFFMMAIAITKAVGCNLEVREWLAFKKAYRLYLPIYVTVESEALLYCSVYILYSEKRKSNDLIRLNSLHPISKVVYH